MKPKQIFIIAFLLSPLSGCGLASIGYNYADVYLRYSINTYASFNESQQETIKNNVNGFMQWHRKEMLPEYVGFLQIMKALIQSGAVNNKLDVTKLRIQLRALYIKTLQPTIKPAASLLSGADAEQIQELVVAFAKENKKQREKEIGDGAEEQLEKRADRSIDFIENLVGGLKNEQIEKIRQLSRQLPYASLIYLQLKEDNQVRLITLLRQSKGEAEIAALLTGWLTSPETYRSSEEQSTISVFENAMDEMVVQVYGLFNERQKKILLRSMDKYIDVFQELTLKV